MTAVVSPPPTVGSDRPDAVADASRNPLRFRPSRRRRNRIAAGVVLGAIAVGANVVAYTSVRDTDPVLQAVQDIPAGTQITGEMLRSVPVEVSENVNAVAGDDLDATIGSYAKVRIVSGSLLVSQAVQATPLVAEGNAVVAVVVPLGELPTGLRERVPVEVVITQRTGDGTPVVVPAETVGLPLDVGSALGERSLSLELAAVDAPTVAAADDVRIVLIEPTVDPDRIEE
ncbi:MAG: SAF domain-containing protein [Actinomycetota bacterium]